LAELAETLALNVDRILLDNMSLDQMREAVRLANGRTPLEASGNITLDNVAAVAAAGVDYISAGSLTHSVKALDISLDL
jgi:nicotinate-nucleotide pyrophosphorylase (carboxylating)